MDALYLTSSCKEYIIYLHAREGMYIIIYIQYIPQFIKFMGDLVHAYSCESSEHTH